MDYQALWIIAIIGTGTLVGVFWRMKGGFGPLNLRAVGLVLIAVIAALLAVAKTDNLNAAMGILAAIAGYLFGANDRSNKKESSDSHLDASAATFGDNARLAGRDLNETVNNINARVHELGELLSREGAKIDRLVAAEDATQSRSMQYLVNTIYERGLGEAGKAIGDVVTHWESDGWKLMGISSDYQGMDGIFVLFQRPSEQGEPLMHLYHGSSRRNP